MTRQAELGGDTEDVANGNKRSSGELWYVLYLLAQGVGTFVWWAAMRWSDGVRSRFIGEDEAAWEAARTILWADAIVFGAGSIAAAFAIATISRWRVPVVWVVVGASWYATLVAVGWTRAPIDRGLGLAVMIPAALLTTWIARWETLRRWERTRP